MRKRKRKTLRERERGRKESERYDEKHCERQTVDGETKRTSEVGRQKTIIQIDRTDINKGFKGRKGNNIYEVRE
jgi:hypothetical protein